VGFNFFLVVLGGAGCFSVMFGIELLFVGPVGARLTYVNPGVRGEHVVF
jgi:hypothetical protein